MRRFAIIVIALVLAPGLQAGIANFPAPMPLPELEAVPLPEIKPLPIPEVEPVIPELGVINPCDACFQYMTELIDQLTQVAVPEVPEIGRPLPEIVPEDIRPLPIPVAPEIEVNPIPMPIAPESEVAPEVEIVPIPIPIAPEASAPPVGSSELLPEDYWNRK